MKIMLVVVVLVGCFAAVNCQSAAAGLCVATGLQNNQNLVTCSTMLAVSSPIIIIIIQLAYNTLLSKFEPLKYLLPMQLHTDRGHRHNSILCTVLHRDLRALYDTCNFTPNPISTSKSLAIN